MPIDYTAWPTSGDVQDRITDAGITLRASVADERYTAIVAAVAQEATSRTRRQFVPSAAGVIRYFDGSGTPEQEVDEFVAFTEVKILQIPLTAPGLVIPNAVAAVENLLPKTRILLQRGAVLNYSAALWDHFPQGRQNIQVTGTWGYGATIPADLWEAVAGEAAARLAAEALFQPGYDATTGLHAGRLASFSDEGVSEKYDFVTTDDGMRWTARYAAAMHRYTRPAGHRLRRWKPPLI